MNVRVIIGGLVGAILPTLIWWFIEQNLMGPFDDVSSRMFYVYVTFSGLLIGLICGKGWSLYDE